MPAFLDAASAAMAWQRTTLGRGFGIVGLATVVMSACITTPRSFALGSQPSSSAARALALNCRRMPGSDSIPNYLNADEKMQTVTGTLGKNVVHPRGPNVFPFERDKQEELNRICPTGRLMERKQWSDRAIYIASANRITGRTNPTMKESFEIDRLILGPHAGRVRTRA